VKEELKKKLKGSGRGLILSYYPGIRLEDLRKMKNLNQDSRSPWPRFEPGTSKYETET
jgi:hypothetical protein